MDGRPAKRKKPHGVNRAALEIQGEFAHLLLPTSLQAVARLWRGGIRQIGEARDSKQILRSSTAIVPETQQVAIRGFYLLAHVLII